MENIIKLDVSKRVILRNIYNLLKENNYNPNDCIVIGSFCYSLNYNDIDIVTSNESIYSFLLVHKSFNGYILNPILIEDDITDSIVDKLTFKNICFGIKLNCIPVISKNYENNGIDIKPNPKNIFNSQQKQIKILRNIDEERKREKEAYDVLQNIKDNFTNQLEKYYPGLKYIMSIYPMGIIAGGFMRDFIIYGDIEHCKDLDIFTNRLCAYHLYQEKFISLGYKQIKFDDDTNDKKFKNTKFSAPNGRIIDLVFLSENLTLTDIIDTFDFTINMVGYDILKDQLIVPKYVSTVYQIEHILSKQLVVTPSLLYKARKPDRALLRLKKFIDKGFTIDKRNLEIFNNKVIELIK